MANAGLVAATIINVNRPKNKRAVKVEDIIGKDITEERNDEVELSEWVKRFAKK